MSRRSQNPNGDRLEEKVSVLSNHPFDTQYRSSRGSIADQFLKPALERASSYVRAAGYFRSSVYWTLESSLRPFIERGGKIRLVCSAELNEDDVRVMEAAYLNRQEVSERALLRELDRLMTLEDAHKHLAVYATLIRFSVVKIKVAVYQAGRGIFHEKMGAFTDQLGNSMSFTGSTNESWMGWHPEGNLESIEVFASWHGGRDQERVEKHVHYLETLWSGNEPGIDVFDLPDAVERRLLTLAKDDIESVYQAPSRSAETQGSGTIIRPLPHQTETVGSWLANGSRGIAKHATGSGKTITGILALRNHLDNDGVGLVLVPSRLLLSQWHMELRKFLPEAAILLAGAGNDRWKGAELPAFTMDLPGQPRIVLAINDTARSPAFLQGVEPGPHLMILADEVHRLGSPENRALLGVLAGPRLGLSATPERAGDPDGTSALLDYFGGILVPEISLRDAIDMGRLVEYHYEVHTVELTQDEIQSWQALSRRIAQAMSGGVGEGGIPEHAKLLLIQRSRLIKKAEGKNPLAVAVLAAQYKPGQRWLVYCEDQEQLNSLHQALRSTGVQAMPYHSGMPSAQREATLEWLREEGGVVLSIRCLDEGVDIPSLTHALIIASSQNPREFIQRRGRVLRRSAGKAFATIHDVIVLPPLISDEDVEGGDVGGISRRIAAAEMGRAASFARDAMNASSLAGIERTLLDLGFTADEVAYFGIEETGEDEA